MFCPKCGSKLPDGSKFCSACGEKIADLVPVTQREQKAADTSVASPMPPVNNPKPDYVQFKKKVDRKKLIVMAIAVVIIIAVLGLKTLFSSTGSDNMYVYLSNGKYELITNLKKDQTIEIASSKSDSTTKDLLAFSPDGKYIYYYTKYDSYSGTGSLCRAEYGKLKENSSNNDKYIEIIATNVSLGFQFLNDGSIAYKNGEGTLYHFNGNETTQIAKNIRFYEIDGSGKILYATGDDSEGYTLYGVYSNDLDNKVKLASRFANVYAADFENILFTKYEDDGSYTLYVVGFEKEEEKIAENVAIPSITQSDGKTYFTAKNGTMLSLYDFVEDTYADADAGITEPNRDDFSIPQYSYKMVSGSNLSEDDFDELYTSCTRDLYWFGMSTWWCYSMEEALDVSWTNTEAVHSAVRSFISKFADAADEDGYILVTDEVKAALLEIQKAAVEPEKEWQWMWLCYNKYQSGTTTDYEAYSAAYDKWYEAKNRISMREALQNKENDYAVQTLYCFDKGTLTAINETVLGSVNYTGGIVFYTTDLIMEKVKIENISYIHDVHVLFRIDSEAENNIILADGTSCRMSAAAAESYAEAFDNGTADLYFTNTDVYLSEGNGTLSVAAIKNGIVDTFAIVTDDAEILSVDGSTLYYTSGSYQNGNVTYCDLYSHNTGTNTRLARDVIRDNINLYSDGVILAYTGYRSYAGYELTMIDSKGEATLVGDNITQYIRVSTSSLLYISDGDLYSYNGKEKTLVRNEADWIWSQNEMEILHTFG